MAVRFRVSFVESDRRSTGRARFRCFKREYDSLAEAHADIASTYERNDAEIERVGGVPDRWILPEPGVEAFEG